MAIQSGKLLKKFFSSDDNAFHAFSLKCHGGQYTTAVYIGTNPPKPLKSVNYLLKGEWITHPKHGKQFKIISYEREQLVNNQETKIVVNSIKRLGEL